jgi:DNA-binding protein H-NS
MTELTELSESELQAMIENAEKALKQKQENKRKEVIAQIKQLAASIGLTVSFSEGGRESSRKGIKVPPKYRNPANPEQTWTGRGVAPKWMQALIAAGHDKSEFEIQ